MATLALEAGIVDAAMFTTLVITAVVTSQAAGWWLGRVAHRHTRTDGPDDGAPEGRAFDGSAPDGRAPDGRASDPRPQPVIAE